MTLNLKLDDHGHAIVRNGHPVYLDAHGADVEFDPAGLLSRVETAEAAVASERIGRLFDRSKYVADHLTIPAEMAHAYFGAAFKLENGQPVAYHDGVKVYSRSRVGEPASLDEALEYLVSRYPHRDRIAKPAGRAAAPASPSPAGARGQHSMPRTAFMQMTPAKQMEFMKAGGTVTD